MNIEDRNKSDRTTLRSELFWALPKTLRYAIEIFYVFVFAAGGIAAAAALFVYALEHEARMEERKARLEEKAARSQQRENQAKAEKKDYYREIQEAWSSVSDKSLTPKRRLRALDFLMKEVDSVDDVSISGSDYGFGPRSWRELVENNVDPREKRLAQLGSFDFTSGTSPEQSRHIRNARFSISRLDNANFSGVSLDNLDLSDSWISKTSFKNSTISNSIFTNVWGQRLAFSSATLNGVDFTESIIALADFEGASINTPTFKNTIFYASDFTEAQIYGLSFEDNSDVPQLRGSNISGAVIGLPNQRYSDFDNEGGDDSVMAADAHRKFHGRSLEYSEETPISEEEKKKAADLLGIMLMGTWAWKDNPPNLPEKVAGPKLCERNEGAREEEYKAGKPDDC